MSVESPPRSVLLRYGHQEGDLLKLRVCVGERVDNGEQVQEVEQIWEMAQAICILEEDRMVVENNVLSATLRRGEQTWALTLPAHSAPVIMRRNGAEMVVDSASPLAPFVFPESPVAVGDSWESVGTLSLQHCDFSAVPLRCTISDIGDDGTVTVEIKSEEMQHGSLLIHVHGKVEFSSLHGCLLKASLENEQRRDPMHWSQWTRIELVERLSVEEPASER